MSGRFGHVAFSTYTLFALKDPMGRISVSAARHSLLASVALLVVAAGLPPHVHGRSTLSSKQVIQ